MCTNKQYEYYSKEFDESPHWSVVRELLSQTFGVPNKHPKSQPFFDRVYTFSVADDRVWFRHYQIVQEDGSLAEIGPRFVLNPIKVCGFLFAPSGVAM